MTSTCSPDPVAHDLLAAPGGRPSPRGRSCPRLSREAPPRRGGWPHRTCARPCARGSFQETGVHRGGGDRAVHGHGTPNVADHEVARATEHAEGWAVALYLDGTRRARQGRLVARMTTVPMGPLGSDRAHPGLPAPRQVLEPLDERDPPVPHADLHRSRSSSRPLCDQLLERSELSRGCLRACASPTGSSSELDPRVSRYRYHHLLVRGAGHARG